MKKLILFLIFAAVSILTGKYYSNKEKSFKNKSEKYLGI